jgi:hypothetical protein
MPTFEASLHEYYDVDFFVFVDSDLIVPNLDNKTQFILCPRRDVITFEKLFLLIWLPQLHKFYPDMYQLQLKISYFTEYGRETPHTDECFIIKFYQCWHPTIWGLGARIAEVCDKEFGDDYLRNEDVFIIRSVEFQTVDPIEVLAWRIETQL